MSRAPVGWVVLSLIVMSLAAGSARAQPAAPLEKLDSAVKSVPADAAFFATMLRNREQIEAIAESKAWAEFKAMPAVQDLWKTLTTTFDDPAQFFTKPENQQLLEVAGDLLSHEVFIYGGENFSDFADLALTSFGSLQFGPLAGLIGGEAGRFSTREMQVRALLHALNENSKLIRVPDMVIGFRMTKREAVETQLKRLDEVVKELESTVPPFKGRFKRDKLAGSEFLTLRLDGSMIPWEDIPFKHLEAQAGEFDALLKKLKETKLTVSIGIKDRYLLVGIGESNGHLAKFAGQGARLSDRAELKPLAKFAERRVTWIGYTSKALAVRVGTSKDDIAGLGELAKTLLEQAPLAPDQRKRVNKDVDVLVKELQSGLVEPGAGLAFSFLNGRGFESYDYDYTPTSATDKPLALVNHVGGAPLLAYVGRADDLVGGYQWLAKWAKVGYGYFEDFAVPTFNADAKEKYQRFVKVGLPLLEKFDKATGQGLLPALDGELAFVLDAKIASRQWIVFMPESFRPLPMLEPALVAGVKDAARVEKAFTEYRDVVNGLLVLIRELSGGVVPELKLPPPEARKTKDGTVYFYALPADWGVDKQLAPSAGLSANVGALTLSPAQAERLLAATPLKLDGGPLAKPDRPLQSAFFFDWARTVEAAQPWADYAMDQFGAAESTAKQVRTALRILQVVRTHASISYVEDGVTVTHTETIIRDLP